jgi:hypothetical protein
MYQILNPWQIFAFDWFEPYLSTVPYTIIQNTAFRIRKLDGVECARSWRWFPANWTTPPLWPTRSGSLLCSRNFGSQANYSVLASDLFLEISCSSHMVRRFFSFLRISKLIIINMDLPVLRDQGIGIHSRDILFYLLGFLIITGQPCSYFLISGYQGSNCKHYQHISVLSLGQGSFLRGQYQHYRVRCYTQSSRYSSPSETEQILAIPILNIEILTLFCNAVTKFPMERSFCQ